MRKRSHHHTFDVLLLFVFLVSFPYCFVPSRFSSIEGTDTLQTFWFNRDHFRSFLQIIPTFFIEIVVHIVSTPTPQFVVLWNNIWQRLWNSFRSDDVWRCYKRFSKPLPFWWSVLMLDPEINTIHGFRTGNHYTQKLVQHSFLLCGRML